VEYKHSDRPAMIASLLGKHFDDAEPLAKELSTRIIQLSSLMEQANQSMYQERKINRGLTIILAALRLSGKPYELNHQQLHDRVLVTSVAISNACQSLSDLDLITVSSDSNGSTEAIYKLTLDGIDVSEKVLVSIHRKEQDLFGVLDEEEKKLLCKLLATLTQRFDAS